MQRKAVWTGTFVCVLVMSAVVGKGSCDSQTTLALGNNDLSQGME